MKNRLLIGFSDKLPQFLDFIEREQSAVIIDLDGSLSRALKHFPNSFYFDPSDHINVASFNVFQNVKQKDKAKLVEDMVAVLNSLSEGGENTLSRLYASTILPVVLTILLDTHDTSFKSVLEFLSDTSVQAKYLKRCKSENATLLWETIQTWEPADRKRAYTFIQSQLSPILLSPILSRTLLGEPTFKLGEHKFFVADLSRSKIGDQAARFLGTLVVARAKPPVYIHGFEFIATDYLASLFSHGGYTLSVPFLSTLPPNVAEIVLGFPEKYIYRTTLEEAEQLKYFAGTLEARNIVDQKEGEFLRQQD